MTAITKIQLLWIFFSSSPADVSQDSQKTNDETLSIEQYLCMIIFFRYLPFELDFFKFNLSAIETIRLFVAK